MNNTTNAQILYRFLVHWENFRSMMTGLISILSTDNIKERKKEKRNTNQLDWKLLSLVPCSLKKKQKNCRYATSDSLRSTDRVDSITENSWNTKIQETYFFSSIAHQLQECELSINKVKK